MQFDGQLIGPILEKIARRNFYRCELQQLIWRNRLHCTGETVRVIISRGRR